MHFFYKKHCRFKNNPYLYHIKTRNNDFFSIINTNIDRKKRHGCETIAASFLLVRYCGVNTTHSTFFLPNSGSTLIKAVTANVIRQRNMTMIKNVR